MSNKTDSYIEIPLEAHICCKRIYEISISVSHGRRLHRNYRMCIFNTVQYVVSSSIVFHLLFLKEYLNKEHEYNFLY